MPQPSNSILELQLSTLQLCKLEVIYGRMLERLVEFCFQHPMPLFEFSKLRNRAHLLNLLSQIVA